ncbi:MAG: hypothetical protein JNL97_07265, partial [Verrucomicrobiales bacterium]|nr:hypothetical protein [Verrucomicrobiales bacterium]
MTRPATRDPIRTRNSLVPSSPTAPLNIHLRRFLETSALAWGALGINLFAPGLFQRRLLAAD